MWITEQQKNVVEEASGKFDKNLVHSCQEPFVCLFLKTTRASLNDVHIFE